MYSIITSRRRRAVLYKLLAVAVGITCIVLWTRKGSLRSKSASEAGNGSQDDLQVPQWIDAGLNEISESKRIERSGNLEHSINEIPREALPVKSALHDIKKSDFNVEDSIDDQRNAFGVSQHNGLEQYDAEIDAALKKIDPDLGQGGEPAHLTGEEEARAETVMKKEAFNMVLSDKMSPNRTVPDARSRLCLSRTFDWTLPTASVVIIFNNEAFSTLVRTVHSVINRTPARVLKQILLVDDFSDRVELGGRLERYMERFFNHRSPPERPLVTLQRLKQRSGLIRARLAGARSATGDVLVFLDSHCECGQQWMEPLLQRIKEDRTAVLTPIIDVIDDKTLQYFNSNGDFFQVGGFTWSGHFTWIDVPDWEQERRGTVADPTRSPTMAGGLFAIDRQYFWESGSYDEGMDVWGGENLEMSFRIWMCGGKIETIPCSRVGHIFRDFHPYSFPGNKDTHGINTARLAEVWMDDYKRLFYLNRPDLQEEEIGSVSERRGLRRQMRCKSFRWYLDNVLPQKFIPDENVQAYGRVTAALAPLCLDTLDRENDVTEYSLGLYDCINAPWRNEVRNNKTAPALCLDMLQRNEDAAYNLGLYVCHSYMAASQMFSLSDRGQLRREEVCATIRRRSRSNVVMQRCSPRGRDQIWKFEPSGRLVHQSTGLCLDRADLSSGDDVLALPCTTALTQIWYFDMRPDPASAPDTADSQSLL